MKHDNARTIGQLVGHSAVRDAIHVPIISAFAKMDIAPGSPVRLDGDWAEISKYTETVGVADPYLREAVKQGQRFWVLIRPGSISTLTHSWTHERIPDAPPNIPSEEISRRRLQEFAEEQLYVSLETMLSVIDSCRSGGDPLYNHEYEGLGVYRGFWEDYEAYTGKQDPNKEKYCYFFTCGGCS